MTPDERTALNEAVCKRLGWTDTGGGTWLPMGLSARIIQPDFTSDWNAVYRWIVPAVKEMGMVARTRFAELLIWHHGDDTPVPWFLYATPEDYCRAFLAIEGD